MSDNVTEAIEKQEQAEDQEFEMAFAEATGETPPDDQTKEDEADSVEEDNSESDNESLAEESEPETEPQDEPQALSLEEQLANAQRERDEWKHKFSSTNGRVSAYQRQVAELTEKIQNPDTSNKDREEAKEELAQQANTSNWDEFKEEFPEFAAALDERLSEIGVREKQLDERFQQLENQVKPLAQQAVDAALKSEYAALEAAHPDYETVASSNEFNEWLGLQPVPVQQLIDSDNAADAAYLLDNFKRATGHNTDASASQTYQQNQAKLQANVAVPSTRRARTQISDDDFESAFNAAVARDERNR